MVWDLEEQGWGTPSSGCHFLVVRPEGRPWPSWASVSSSVMDVEQSAT